MRITFLGTSHGLPEADRYCTSVLVEASGKHYLIDAGAPISDLLTREGVAFSDLSAIFLTHLHGDHIDGLVQFADLSTWYYTASDPIIYTPDLALKAGLEAWQALLFAEKRKEFRYVKIEAGEIYADEAIRVNAISTMHQIADKPGFVRRSYAFAFDEISSGRRALFTGDLRADMTDFPEEAFRADFDLIVTEGAHAHLDQESVRERLSRCRTPKLVVSHLSPCANPAQRLDALRAALPMELIVAADGMRIEL